MLNEKKVTGLISTVNVLDNNENAYPNIDAYYGPFNSVDEAWNALVAADMNVVGRTVGVVVGETIKEYWLNGGTDKAHFVEKMPAQSGGAVDAYTKAEADGKFLTKTEAENEYVDNSRFEALDTYAKETQALASDLEDQIEGVQDKIANSAFFKDVPEKTNLTDPNKYYVRTNGAWVDMTDASDVFDWGITGINFIVDNEGAKYALTRAGGSSTVPSMFVPYASKKNDTWQGGLITKGLIEQIYTNKDNIDGAVSDATTAKNAAKKAYRSITKVSNDYFKGFKLLNGTGEGGDNDTWGVDIAHTTEDTNGNTEYTGGILSKEDYAKLVQATSNSYKNYKEDGTKSIISGSLDVKCGTTNGGVSVEDGNVTFKGTKPVTFTYDDTGYSLSSGDNNRLGIVDGGLSIFSIDGEGKGAGVTSNGDGISVVAVDQNGNEGSIEVKPYSLSFQTKYAGFTFGEGIFKGMTIEYDGSFVPFFASNGKGTVFSGHSEQSEVVFSLNADSITHDSNPGARIMIADYKSGYADIYFDYSGIKINDDKVVTESALSAKIGDTSTLVTNESSDLVSAINEIASTKPDMVGENLVDGTASQFVYKVASADQNGKNVKTSYNFGSRAYQLKASSLARVVVKLEGLRKVGSEQLIAIFASNSEGDQCEIFRLGSAADFSNRTSSNINVPLSFDSSNIEGFAGQTIYMRIKGFSAGKISISDLKVENGTKSTAWCISESDKVANINKDDYYTKSEADGKYVSAQGHDYATLKDTASIAKANADALRSIVGEGINGKTLTELSKSLNCVTYTEELNESNVNVPTIYNIGLRGDGYESSTVRLAKNNVYISASDAKEQEGSININGTRLSIDHDNAIKIGGGDMQTLDMVADEGIKMMSDSILIADKQDRDIDLLALLSDFPRYNSTILYSEGMYVIYKGILYRCKSGGTHGGDFKKNEWDQVGLYTVLIDIMEKIS